MKKLDFLPNLRNRYSIRRFTVGTASILIGSLLFLGHNGEAKAAENTNDNTVVEASKDTSTTQQAPVENTVPQDKTTDTIQQTGNSQTTQNVLETVKTDALSKLSTFTHLTEETVKHYTAEIKQAQSEADVQAVVEKAQKAEVEAEKQAEVAKQTEQTKATDTSTASSATTPEVSKSITDVVKEESKVEPSSTLSDTSKDADTKTVSSTAQAISTIETPTLSIEQKVDKVKAELVTDYDSSKVDAALAVIDTADLTADQIKAEVLKLLLEQGSAEKDLYSPQATVLRTEEEAQKTAVRAFSIDTSTKDNVVVTPDNFNQYFWTVDDAYYDPATGITTLTQNWPSQKGSMSLDTKMNVNKDFHFSGWVNLGDKYEGHPKEGVSGGDGIAFIFNPGNTHDLGLYGSALGVGGLKYAFGFKLDTFVNTQYDPKGKAKPDPIQFNKVGAFGAFVFADSTGTVSTQPGLTGWKAALLDVQPDNNQFQEFTIDYSGDTKVMTITYAGQTWTQSMTKYFSYTHKNEYALSIAATTGGAYNLQQVKIKEFTYTAAALLEEDFVDTDTQELFDRPLRTSGDVDSIITVQDHSAYLAEKGYKLISEDTSFAHTYDKTKKTVKLTNASQFIVYQVKDIEPPKIGDITEQTVNVNSEMTPLVLDITDNSKYIKTKTVTGLPAGVTFDEATNTISGTPTDVGTSTITVTATDHAGLTTTKTFTYTVVDTQPPTITQVENKTTEAYTPITPIALSADDNSKVAPTLEVTGLPAGLSFDPSTKQITGTPTAEGTFTVTVKATDGSTNASNSTFNIVVNPNAALEALKTAVADAKTVNKNDFTPNSVAVLDAKLTEAEALIAHPENGSTDQFNAKTQEVKQAKDQLVRKANKTDLEKAIAEASKYTNLDPAKPMDQQLITALANAKNTDADQNATKEQVDTATADLNKAIEQKLYQDALDRLNAAITDAKGVNQSEYTPASVTPFDAAIKAGETKAADKTATPEQLDLATKSITDAKAQLQHNADKSALEAAINKAKALGVLNETDTEDKAVKDALTLGESVKDNANATTQQVADATKAINDAIAAKAHADALDALKAKLVEVKALDKAPFTPDSVNALNAQVTAGDTVVAAEKSKTTEEIKEATQALTDAQKALVKQADKTELQKAIDKAGTLGQLNPSDTEDKAVQDALAKANQVKADGNATPQQVTEATDALNKAIDKKLYQDALDELNAAIKDAEAVTKANYTPETVTPFETALTDGKAKAADTQATPEQLKAAAQAIKTAKDALKQKANKAELEKSIATAEALQPLKAGDPEDDAVKAALEKAKQVEANQNADQAAVDAAKVELDNAIKAKQTQDAADALKQAALDELKAELAKVAKIDKNNFTPESVTPLTEKETAGNAIVANPENKTVDEIKAATQALKDAEKGLQAKSDKAALQAAIDKAEALTGLNPADAEDKAVQDALAAAKKVNDNPNASQTEVQAATKTLNDAVAAKEHADALDALKAELAKVAGLNKDQYTPNSVAPLNTKEADGKAIVAAPEAKTTDEIKAATEALKAAEAGLVDRADKTALQTAIEKAEALPNLDAADKEDKAVQDALAAAKTVKEDANATPEAVQAATKTLNDAVAAKERQDALDELNKAIEKAEAVNKDSYTPDSVAPFTTALNDGKAKAADANATPAELKAAAKAITDAQNQLQPVSDKAALQAAIAKAEALKDLNPADKEDKAVQDALAAAKAVNDNANATPDQVTQATKALNEALAAKERQDALDELQKALDAAKAVNKDDYKPNTVAPFEAAVTAGEAAKADATKTPAELKEAAKAIKDAQNALQAKANKAELEKSIATAEGLGALNPADAEDKAVQDALNKAKEVQADPNADQAAVDAAKKALDDAINAKKAQDAAAAKQAALDALKAELAKVAQIDKNNFTPNTVTPLTEKEDAGKAIVAAPNDKTTDEIKAATQALKDAEAALQAKSDKAALQAAIDKANALGQLDPADKEDKALQDAVAAGETVKADGNATPQQVQEATKAINDAIAAKERQDALDELQKALDDAKTVNKDDYKPNTVAPFEAAITAGEAAKADATKTPEELKAAAKAITDAKNNLEAKANKDALNKAITTAEGLTLDPNDKEDKAVQDALAKAKEVQADPNADQAAVDAAKAALEDAINAKNAQDAKDAKEAADAKQAALDALKAELEKAKAVQKDNFTPDSVKPLTDAETAGQAIVDAPTDKTVEEINKATQALKDAQAGLVAKADKAELDKAITAAEGLTLDPNDKEDKAVQDALNKAKEVQANPNATQDEVNAAKDALNKAIEAKTAQDQADAVNAALDALKAELEKAKAVQKDNFTPDSVKPLTDAETAGQAIVDAPTGKTVEEINKATQALKDAQAGLVAKADKTELEKSIATAEGLGQLDPADKEDKAVQDALAAAKAVEQNPNATQTEVDNAKAALDEAINAKKAQDAKEAKEAADAKQAALDELKAELAKVAKIDLKQYTPDSVKPLTDKEIEGNAIVAIPDAKTTEEIKVVTQALKDAQKDLVQKADKAELQKAIDKANALGNLDANDPEDKAVQDKLADAEKVKADDNATPQQVAEATKALNDAIAAKERQDALDELQKAIDAANAINKDDYKPNTVKPLEDAVKAGETAKADAAKTPAELKEAAKAITDAQKALEAKANKDELNKVITTAEGLTLDPNDKEDKAVQDALAKAKEVQADPNASQADVDAAKAALENAVNAKKAQDEKEAQAAAQAKQDALDALKAELEKVAKINKNNFTPNTVTPLTEKEEAGKAIVANPDAKTTEEIKAATQALIDAENALQAKSDKAALQAAIDKANGLGELNPADKEDKAVQDAVAAGEKVKADGNATPQQVADATKAINDAFTAKERQDALDELQKAIDAANAINKDDYKPNTVKPLEDAVKAGETAKADAAKTPAELKEAAQAIKDAQKALEAKANKDELNKVITTAEGLTLDPTDKEDKAVQDALAKAKEVQADANASQADVDAAKAALEEAINAKQAQDAKEAKEAADAKQAALDALKAELEKAKAINKDNFTPNSVKPLTDAETTGQAIVDAPDNKTTKEIEAATQALKDAQAGLVAKADKAELEKAINTAEGLTLDPNDKEDKAVQDALNKAKEVEANPNATQDEVNAAKDALNKAVEAKVAQDQADAVNAALDALKAELEKAKTVNKDNFTPDSVKPLTDAETAGQAIVNDSTGKTVEEIEEATQALKDAQAGLVAKADKAELEKAINTAEGLTLDPSDKEDKAVQDALAKAKEVEANPNATQDEVNAAKDALNKAIEAKAAQDKADAVNAALDALKAELEKAKAINKDNFTPNSVKPLTDAETAGQSIVNDPTGKTVEQINAATQALKDAQADLVAKADKSELQKAIDKANALGNLDANDKEDKAVQDAVASGEKVKADGNATSLQVADATKAINDAIVAKEHQDALDELQKALDAANTVKKEQYKPSTVAPFEAAVTAGEAAKVDATKTPQELRKAAKAITDAQKALEAKANKVELEKSIATAENLGQLDPTDKEDKAVQDALSKAKEVEANLNATQAEVDAAKDALNKAIEGKTAQDKADAVNAALDALKAELEKAKAINKDNFTPNSVEALVDAMAVAQGIVNNPESVTVEQIEKATQALKYAQAGLVAKADKAELEKAIENAEGLTLDPADKEDKAVQDALDKAKEVQADPNASQADVDAAKDALNKAIEAKTAQDKADAVNTALDALKAELEKAKAVNKDNFTPNSVEALVDAMAVAQGIVNNPESVTVEQIEKATQALKDAQAGLVAKADKAELEKAINTAEDLTLDPSDKEDKAVQDALAKAKEVEANPNATQDEVNAAKDALNKAIEAKATQDKADAVNAALDALKAELEKAKAINKDNFTPNSVEPLADAMAVAQGIVNNPESVTIEQIEKATQALKDAQAGLVAKANKVELEKSIATAENLGQLDPTDKEDKAVHDALSKAKEVEANPNATQDEVNAAKDALNKAIEVKAAQDKADALAELQKTLDKAQSIDRTKYTPETVKDLDKSVDKGKVVVENSKEVSIKTIEDATKAIKDSLKDLVVKVDASETEKVAHTAKTTTGKSVERASDKAVKKSEGSTAQAKANKTSKAKVLPNTGQEAPADPKYATLMLAIGGLMAMFGRRKKEDKDNTEK